MSKLTGNERAKYVRDMFTAIAPHYDRMNRLMTGGQDVRWRKKVIQLARIGDLAREALSQFPKAKVIGADFTFEMMRTGNKYGGLNWSAADALHLPFQEATFDAIVSGFLIRNVTNLNRALEEQYRTLKPGGRVIILDTTRPKKNILSPLIWVHMHIIIPVLGKILTGVSDAYRYLPESTEGFLTAEEMLERMSRTGFKNVKFQRLMFGTIAIHHAEK